MADNEELTPDTGDGGPPEPGGTAGGGVLGTGEDTGGTGSTDGGGGGGGGGSGLQDYLRGLLQRMRIPIGPFGALIRQAASGNWSPDEFMFEMSNSPQFRRMFPGIQELFDQGMSVTSAVTAWRKMSATYEQVAKDLGLANVAKLTPKKVGIAIKNGLDAEEFALRLQILNTARHSEATREAFNRILKNKGDIALDKKGWFKFLMGKSDRKLYDIWEGVQLFQEFGEEGLNIRKARQLARAVGGPGVPVDLSNVGTAVDAVRREIGSDVLRQAGVKTADLALVALSEQLGSKEAKDKAADLQVRLEQMIRNARAGKSSTDVSGATSVVGAGRPVTSGAPTLEGG